MSPPTARRPPTPTTDEKRPQEKKNARSTAARRSALTPGCAVPHRKSGLPPSRPWVRHHVFRMDVSALCPPVIPRAPRDPDHLFASSFPDGRVDPLPTGHTSCASRPRSPVRIEVPGTRGGDEPRASGESNFRGMGRVGKVIPSSDYEAGDLLHSTC